MTKGRVEKTEWRRTIAQREAALRRELRLKTIGEVAAVLSHESRNLLGALGTCSQLLKRNPNLTPEELELLDILQSGAHRLSEIIAEFSVFRVNSTRYSSIVNLHELIDETLESLSRDERWSPELVVQRTFEPGLPMITADHERLRQMIWQLLLNAGQAQGKSGRIEVATARKGTAVRIVVGDQGIGIPKHVRPRIFEPLFTTKTRAAGLGLTIVKHVVEEHGGAIRVTRSAGNGARFVVILPISSRQSGKRAKP